MKIQNFTDLIVWQKSHHFVLHIYNVTREFPVDEKFGLVNQIRRASVSITSNIAEGFYRKTIQDKKHFYFIALSSLGEVHNQLLLAKDLKYLAKDIFHVLMDELIEIRKMIGGFIKSTQTMNDN